MNILGIDVTRIVLAADLAARRVTPEFQLGTKAGYEHPTLGWQEFVYVQAGAAITGAAYSVSWNTGFVAQMVTTANTAAGTFGHGSQVGVAQAAMATGDQGWVQVWGRATLRTLASAARGTRLNTTATAGVVDDDGTAGARPILGMTLGTATGGAEANNSDAYLSYPSVGLTI